jgi:PAS domain S-box-containing protein
MFRVRETDVGAGHSVAVLAVLAALLVALFANLSSCYLVFHEYHLLSGGLMNPESPSRELLDALRSEVILQVISTLFVSVTLVLCTMALWWLRRHYLASQQSLRRVKMLAHDILASMGQGVITTNRQAVITSINSAAIRLLEVDFECVGRPLTSISPADVPLEKVYREVVEGRTAVRDRDFNVDRAGRILRLRVDGHTLKDTEGTALGCVIHLRDVTERMLMEERMHRMERFLNLATLASGLHHEIKNPLTALSIHIQLLEEGLANGQAVESVDELVGVLKTEVCRLNGVLESFRSFANLQRLALQPTDALAVVENAIRLIRPQAAEQRIQITLLHPEKELPLVPLDPEKLEQAILNLVINALEAMPEGGNLTISAAVLDGELHVSVKDSGPGISPEVQKNLFRPYFSTKSKGSGMGLALSEKLISQHGGRIDYRTSSAGTTFDITVPLEQGNGDA